MPTYEFRNKETGEVVERFMSMSAREQFLIDNPNLEQTMTQAPAMGYRIGTPKIPGGFKDVLNTIHERTAGSTLKQNTTGNIGA